MVLIMSPQISLMSNFLQIGSVEWDLDQLKAAAAGKAHKLRLDGAWSGTRLLQFFRDVLQTMLPKLGEGNEWDGLGPNQRDLAAQSTAFAMLAKAVCGIHAKIWTPQHLYPFKLFGVLADPDLASQIVSDPPCTYDDFTFWYGGIYKTESALKSDESMHVLRALAIVSR